MTTVIIPIIYYDYMKHQLWRGSIIINDNDDDSYIIINKIQIYCCSKNNSVNKRI